MLQNLGYSMHTPTHNYNTHTPYTLSHPHPQQTRSPSKSLTKFGPQMHEKGEGLAPVKLIRIPCNNKYIYKNCHNSLRFHSSYNLQALSWQPLECDEAQASRVTHLFPFPLRSGEGGLLSSTRSRPVLPYCAHRAEVC